MRAGAVGDGVDRSINVTADAVGLPSTYIAQSSTTGARPVLRLTQQDVSEEFIHFVTTTGTNNAYSNAAVGAYRGKIRVRTPDGLKWIPIYD